MKKIFTLSVIFCFVLSITCFAQDSLMMMAQKNAPPAEDYTIATFKSFLLINQQTLEVLGPRTLNLEISHRFGTLNSGSYNAFGLDGPANLRIGLDYSYDGRLMAGIGRSSNYKLFDGYLKYRLLRQRDDEKMPLSVTLFTSADYTALNNPPNASPEIYTYSSDRFSYVYEIMAGRKITNRLSFQVSGTLVHNNITLNIGDKNDIYAVGGCLRYKITRSLALTAEYAYALNNYTVTPDLYVNSIGIGIEIETGGHVFQIFVTNSFDIDDAEFIPFTQSASNNGGFRVGFNISRVFHM